MRRFLTVMAIAIPLLCILSAFTYYLPPVHDRLAWRVEEFWLMVKYTLNPPQKVVFVPQEQEVVITLATLSLTDTPIPSSTPSPTMVEASAPVSETPAPSPTATIATTPLPDKINLKGVRYQDQHGRYNYCAPANLAMALSFWGWNGDQDLLGPVIKPDNKDKNVMPYEMVDYIEGHTDLRAVSRIGGDLDLLKRFLAAGFPVLVEKGTYLRDLTGVTSWMGHYQVLTGYDEAEEDFIAQDSYTSPDFKVANETLVEGWRAFNYAYIIIYPPDKEAEVLDLLGPDADETTNYQNAALKASNEIFGLTGISQYFAWYNRGTSLMLLQDYAGASEAYDESFALYPSLPEVERPWRMLWYQTGPYFAYFYSGRYYDVLYLADATLDAMQSDKNLEESYYWRGMAKAALGDTSGAIEDFRTTLKYHEVFEPALYQLRLLGADNP
jgi:tetratricopeptide (TPR) repeat protein